MPIVLERPATVQLAPLIFHHQHDPRPDAPVPADFGEIERARATRILTQHAPLFAFSELAGDVPATAEENQRAELARMAAWRAECRALDAYQWHQVRAWRATATEEQRADFARRWQDRPSHTATEAVSTLRHMAVNVKHHPAAEKTGDTSYYVPYRPPNRDQWSPPLPTWPSSRAARPTSAPRVLAVWPAQDPPPAAPELAPEPTAPATPADPAEWLDRARRTITTHREKESPHV